MILKLQTVNNQHENFIYALIKMLKAPFTFYDCFIIVTIQQRKVENHASIMETEYIISTQNNIPCEKAKNNDSAIMNKQGTIT